MTANNPSEAVCSICGGRGHSFYKIVQMKNGIDNTLTTCCSVTCLLKWLGQYAAMQGMRLTYGAKQAWGELRKLLGGGG